MGLAKTSIKRRRVCVHRAAPTHATLCGGVHIKKNIFKATFHLTATISELLQMPNVYIEPYASGKCGNTFVLISLHEQ